MDGRRELAGQRAQRSACGLCRAGLDQVGNGLGLCEVELVVQERPLGKLAGPGAACAERDRRLDEQGHDHRPAVSLQFEDVLPRERVRRLEIQGHARVDRRTVAIRKPTERRDARGRQAGKHPSGNSGYVAARQANDTDSARAGRRRDCNNGVVRSGHTH